MELIRPWVNVPNLGLILAKNFFSSGKIGDKTPRYLFSLSVIVEKSHNIGLLNHSSIGLYVPAYTDYQYVARIFKRRWSGIADLWHQTVLNKIAWSLVSTKNQCRGNNACLLWHALKQIMPRRKASLLPNADLMMQPLCNIIDHADKLVTASREFMPDETPYPTRRRPIKSTRRNIFGINKRGVWRTFSNPRWT